MSAIKHCLVVQYDGEWLNNNGVWLYEPGKARCFLVSEGQCTKFEAVLNKLYEIIEVDQAVYDIVIKVMYNIETNRNIPLVIKDDSDFDYILHQNSMRPMQPIPLCITLMDKPLRILSVGEETVESPHKMNMDFNDEEVVGDMGIEEPQVSPPVVQQVEEELDGANPTSNGEDIDPDTPGAQSSTQNRGKRVVAPMRSFQSVETTSSARLSGKMGGQNWVNGFGPYSPFEVGYTFENKLELKMTAQRYSITKHFRFRTFKSNPDLYVLKCKSKPEVGEDQVCTWNLRAVRLAPSQHFQVRTYVREHTCSILESTCDTRQATALVLGDTLKEKYQSHKTPHPPRKVIDDVKDIFGLTISYNKAWRSVEAALTLVRGTVEDSYASLPSYLYMLKKTNEGTVTDLVVDDDGSFRYMFMALGVLIRGFRCSIRPVLCVDACHIKHKCGGHMLVAIGIDANEQLYPVAIGVVDGENNRSWDYFMMHLRAAIGTIRDLVFVSDRHQSIANALENHFPEAHHGACTYHLKRNIMSKFKTNSCHREFDWAANAPKVAEFQRHFDVIKDKHSGIATYLEDIGYHAWARSHFPGNRYDFMTSNYAESFNALCNDARRFPITTMLDWIRRTLSNWFAERRTDAATCRTMIATNFDEELKKDFEKAIFYNVFAIDDTQFEVQCNSYTGVVDLARKTCSCREFNLRGLPCTHAIAAARRSNTRISELCSKYYTTNCWTVSYVETIHPPGDEEDWDVPEDVKAQVCLKPKMRVRTLGRPCEKRKRSRGEGPKKSKKCSSCQGYGHNRASCKNATPAPSTVSRNQ